MTLPLVWSLCASDSRCGAGMQAVMAQAAINNVECRAIVTALTAQSHQGVASAETVSLPMLEAQWQTAQYDGQPDAVVVGWLPADTSLIRWVIEKINTLTCPIIWDPVIQATTHLNTGAHYGFEPAIDTLRELIPSVTVMTPSLAEAQWLLNDESCDAFTAARKLQQLGAQTVMITGGDSPQNHCENPRIWITDMVVSQIDESQPETAALPEFAIHQRPIEQQAHGTGSQLAAAIAVYIAQGQRMYDALLLGAMAAREALKNSGTAQRRSQHALYGNAVAAPLPNEGDEWPLVTAPDARPTDEAIPIFPRVGELGLYALTDNLEHLQHLIELDVDTIQWRVKEKNTEYEDTAEQALQRCRDAGIPCWFNDDWQLALVLKPDGVHLGQEDMLTADLCALRKAGIAVGISTHTHWEIARARAINPSYIAFGPVYPPLSKQLKYPPLGVEKIRQWHHRYPAWPHTCIGGIVPANAEAVAATQIGSLAIVTCLQPGPEQENNANALKQALKRFDTSPK